MAILNAEFQVGAPSSADYSSPAATPYELVGPFCIVRNVGSNEGFVGNYRPRPGFGWHLDPGEAVTVPMDEAQTLYVVSYAGTTFFFAGLTADPNAQE